MLPLKNSSPSIKKAALPQILIVDDDPFNLLSLEMILKRLQIACTKAFNGQEAVEILQNNSETYDLIIMDYQMPVMDGITATKVIRELGYSIPIIACTAFNSKEDFDNCIEAGMNECIHKPINANKIKGLLKQYICF